jgi:hypothetical protein
MKTVVVFQSDLFDLTWPRDEDLESKPWGEDLAQFFMEKIRAKGGLVRQDQPYRGYDHWAVYYEIDRRLFGTQFRWAAFDSKEIWWTLQTWRARGCFGGLFGGDVSPARELLGKIIDEEPRIRKVQWLTKQQFGTVYGKKRDEATPKLLEDSSKG